MDRPLETTIVVHVRLSDMLTRDDCQDEPPCLMSLRLSVYPFSWYDDVIKKILQTPGAGKQIIVVGYAYHGGNQTRSFEYRNGLVAYFKGKGFVVSARPDSLPDDDFVYMSSAKFLVRSLGGYARLVAQVCMRACIACV